MLNIFISYSKNDTEELALALAEALNSQNGISAWMDRSLRVGSFWESELQRQIQCCDVMVVLCSSDINRFHDGKPSYVLHEIAYARQHDKRIIPVLVENLVPPLALISMQHINFTAQDLALQDLVSAILYELDLDIPVVTPVSLTPTPAQTDYNKNTGPLITPRPLSSSEAVRRVIGEPFSWCSIPGGEFIYGDSAGPNGPEKLTLPTFSISQYLITYSQFQVFIEAEDGFKDPRWWKGLFFDQSKFHGEQAFQVSNHPRERVSWYDAIAFCRWLSFRLGGGYDINNVADWRVRLPTDYEWEKAARGKDGLLFPYGNEFDKNKCNTREADIDHTTPVDRYPHGASPYGVYDLSGNVWEWCLTNWSRPAFLAYKEDLTTSARRVLRGGSWSHNRFSVRTVYRFYAPHERLNFCGFRICRTF